MKIRRAHFLGVTVVIAFGLAGGVAAQGNKKPTSQPGTADFRCDDLIAGCAGLGAADRILGMTTPQNPDGLYEGAGTPEGGQGAHLRSNNEMWIGLRNGLEVLLDFSELQGGRPCDGDGNCRFNNAFPTGQMHINSGYSEFQTNVVNPNNPNDSTFTLLNIAPGQSGEARMKISFNDPNLGLLWGFNFSTVDYAGATNINVMRSNDCTWIITADGSSRAGLSAYGRTGSGKAYRTDEGLYIAPFEITFTVPSMCP